MTAEVITHDSLALADSLRTPRRLEGLVRSYPQFAGGFAIVAGVVVLVGWFADVRSLTTMVPGGAAMVANTAVMCMLAGVALWLAAREPFAGRARRLARACAIVVCVISGLTLIEYGFSLTLIDRWLPHAPGPWPEGRPSPQTATAFLCLASALLLIDTTRGGRRPADYLAVAATLIGVSALLGYLFGIPARYGVVMSHIGMSVPTALVLVTLGFGLLAARIHRGVAAVVLARDAGGVIARRLLGGLLLFPPVVIVLLGGVHVGWYPLSFAAALVVLVATAESTAFIISTARRLSDTDSEMWRVTRALHDSEARVRTLVEQASDAIFVADLEGRYTQVNEAACRLLGYARDELVGRSIADVVARDELPRLSAHKAVLLEGRTDVSEWRLRRHDGTEVPVEVSAKIFADGRWQGIVRDITERRRAQAALAHAARIEHELRAELEALLTASSRVSEAVAELPRSDLDTVLRTIAEQARELTGARYAAAAIGSDPEHAFERWATVGMSDEVAMAIGRAPRPVGVLGDVLSHRQAVRIAQASEHHAFRGMPLAHPEITSLLAVPIHHRKRLVGTLYLANKQGAGEFSDDDLRVVTGLADRVAFAIETATLYESEAKLRTWLHSLIDQLPEGVIVLDDKGEVKAMNRAVRMLALPPSGETDRWGNAVVFDIRDGDGKPLPFEDLPIVRALAGTVVRDRQMLLRQSDGRMLPVSASASPVRDERDRITGAVAVVSDISERKEMERMREEWTAVVAHDLRQPLNTILLWSDRVAALATEDKQRLALERIRRAGWRLNRMIEDLLDAARISANQLRVEPHAVDLVALVEATLENLRFAHPSVPFHLVSAGHELAWADDERIQQVLGNLLGNAVKYGTPETEIRVEVTARDHTVEVAVINRGPDIPADELARLFTRFSRTQHARDSHIPGIGLGLYICRGLVEAHGGRIWAESADGTIAFRFTVPRPPTE